MNGSRRTFFVFLLGVALSSVMFVRGQEPKQGLSVPIIGAPEASSDAEPQMEPMPTVPVALQPTLPDARLPQYRLLATSADERIEELALRFLLALPKEPLLIEAQITIDGEPFRRKRDKRVRAALKAALAAESEPSPPTIQTDADPKKDADSSEAKTEPAKEPAFESSVAAYQQASTEVVKLKRYIASIGREPSLAEVRWFFDNRLFGPALLLLKDGFQAFRSRETPVFHILDRNRDGAISREEIEQSQESFLDCDLNRDGIVTYREISEAAKDPRRPTANARSTSSLLHLLPTEKDADEVYAELLSQYGILETPAKSLAKRFDANADGKWDQAELENLRTMPADISIGVAFDSKPGKSSLIITQKSLDRLAEQQIQAEIVKTSIVLKRPDCEVWLSAIQGASGDQIALGAVMDGYPMLPVLDANADGRFTIRELRDVTEAVAKFDADGDGQILQTELRPAIRVCFGLGPSVHEVLAGVRNVHEAGQPLAPGPEWFVRMDRNKDNDLTRQEFPGTDEQFRELDADKDELISGQEALEYEKAQSSPDDKESTEPPKAPATKADN